LVNDCNIHPNKITWCSLLKDLLGNLGFYEAWLFQDVGNDKVFISNVKQRINDNFIQNWNERLGNSSRANLYKNIAVFKFQPYLDLCTITKFRICFSKLRCSSHRLHVESGRWAKPPVPIGERKCHMCNTLEDEFHFVLECRMYSELRSQYIPFYYRNRPNVIKFIELLKTENKTLLHKLCCYIYKSFIVRASYTYVPC